MLQLFGFFKYKFATFYLVIFLFLILYNQDICVSFNFLPLDPCKCYTFNSCKNVFNALLCAVILLENGLLNVGIRLSKEIL